MATFSDLRTEVSDLKSLAESISRQLRGWAQHLQDTPIRGQRHLTSKLRQIDQARRDRDKFVRELAEMSKKPIQFAAQRIVSYGYSAFHVCQTHL